MLTWKQLSVKMKDSAAVKAFIKSARAPEYGRTIPFTITEKYRGEYIARYYMIRFEGKNMQEKHYLEYYRISENLVQVCRNLEFTRLGGYQVKFPYMKTRYTAVLYGLDAFTETRFNMNISDYNDITNYEKLIADDPELKYCVRDESIRFINFVRAYREFKEVELLGKLKMSWLLQWKSITKLQDNEKKRFFKYVIRNADEINKQRFTLKFNEIYYGAFPEKQILKREREKNKIKVTFKRVNRKLETLSAKLNKPKNITYNFNLPKSVDEIKSVGNELLHCYRGETERKRYLENHLKGQSILVFIKDAESKPIATAEITNTGKITQLRAKSNDDVKDSKLRSELDLIVPKIKAIAKDLRKKQKEAAA